MVIIYLIDTSYDKLYVFIDNIFQYILSIDTDIIFYLFCYVQFRSDFGQRGHEGTNFGLKAHAASVRPNQGLHQAAAAMGIQDTCKSAECDLIIGNDMRYKDKSEWTSNTYASEMLSFF